MKKYLVAKIWSDGSLSLCMPATPMADEEAQVFLDVNQRSDPEYKYVKLEVLGD